MSVTITASANSTIPASTVFATCQLGTVHYEAIMLADTSGCIIGVPATPLSACIANSPSVVVSSGSVIVTNGLSASISNTLTASAIQGTAACPAAAWPMRLTDLVDTVAVTAASELLVSVNNVASAIVSSGSVVVTNALSASISGGSVALLTGANVIGSASVIQSTPTGIGNAWPMKITDGTDTVSVNSSSQLSVAVSSASVTIVDGSGNVYGVSAASPLYITGGAAGGTSSNDKATFAEGTTSLTPIGGVFLETTASLTASQMGMARLTASRALHVNLRDASGLQLGVSAGSPLYTSSSAVITNSPSVIVSSGSVVVTNALSASISNVASVIVSSGSMVVTNGLSASISGGSVALLTGANVIGSASVIQSTGAAITSPWAVRLSDSTDSAAITAASEVLVNVNNSPSVVINSGSVVVTNGLSASLSNVSFADKTTFSEGASPLVAIGGVYLETTASLTASQMSPVRLTASRAFHVNLRDASGLQLGVSAGSPLFVAASSVVTNQVSASISNVASVIVSSGSLVVTNALSASISGGSVALLTGANVIGSASVIQSTAAAYTSPWPVKQSDGTDSLSITAASEALVFVNNVASVIVSSGSLVVTNALSASISGGSVALLTGANVIGSASAIQGTAAAITAPWPVKISDSVDSAFVDSACRLAITLTDATNAYGLPASPLAQAGQGQTMYWAGSQLTINQVNLSSSISGCTRIVASTAGAAIVVLNATFTTSSCQFIGWIASGAGAASALVQTAMPFGTNGGMDAKRSPDAYLWLFPSGSNAIITTTSACNVAGTINYITVAS